MIFRGRGISRGLARGEVLKFVEPFSFLGGVDPKSGELRVGKGNLRDHVFVFPCGKGSTVGSYVIYDLKVNGNLPAAIINSTVETIVATGAVISGVPLVDSVDIDLLRDGDSVTVNGGTGEVILEGVVMQRTATCFLRYGGEILMLKRSDKVGSFQGKWAGVSGYIEDGETARETAIREVFEEVGMSGITLSAPVRRMIREDDNIWCVEAFLAEAPTREVDLDWEHTDHLWVEAGKVRDMDTVPGLLDILDQLL